MKKIIITLLILINSLFLINLPSTNAVYVETPTSKETSYNVVSGTYEVTLYLDKEYDFKYDKSSIDLIDNGNFKYTFLILRESDTPLRIMLCDKTDNDEVVDKIVSLTFVKPETVSLAYRNGYYYVKNGDKPLYGDFKFIVDGKEVIANEVQGDDVYLVYNGAEYRLEGRHGLTKMQELVIFIIGIPLLAFVIFYLIYIMIPINNYKNIYRTSNKLIKKLNRIKENYSKVIFALKFKLPQILTMINSIDSNDPKYKEFKTVESNLNLALDNALRLEGHFPSESVDDFVSYIIIQLTSFNRLTDNGTYRYKNNVDIKKEAEKEKSKFKEASVKEMDRNQKDSYRYLESINVIKHDEVKENEFNK